MRIVILDSFTISRDDLSWDDLKAYGYLDVYERTSPDLIVERSKDAEAILTSKCIISREVIEKCPNLKYIGVLATGYNMVDLDYAKDRGIAVTNVPAYSTSAVAQFTISLMMMLATHAEKHTEAVKDRMWENSLDFSFTLTPQIELEGKTLGIIGFGNIGKKVATIAAALGMNVLIATRYPDQGFLRDNIHFATQEKLLSCADIISLHTPLYDHNKEFINSDNIARMKDGVILINTSRGPLVNEKDLDKALRSGKVKAAALDVLSKEPPKNGNILISSPNCYITPHIAWSTKESRSRLMNLIKDNVESFVNGEELNRIV